MKLGDNTVEKWEAFARKDETSDKKLAIERRTESSLQVFKMVNSPPVIFVSFRTFVNLTNFAPEMDVLSLPSDLTTYLFSTPTVLYHCYNWYRFFYLWFVTLFVNLLCETCKFYSMFWVKIATEGRKLFLSSEYHAKWSFFKSSTLPCGFIKKKSSGISNLNLNLHHHVNTCIL